MTDLEDLFDGALTVNMSNIENIEGSSTNIGGLCAEDEEEIFETNQIFSVRTMNPGKKVLTYGFDKVSDNHMMDFIDNLNQQDDLYDKN